MSDEQYYSAEGSQSTAVSVDSSHDNTDSDSSREHRVLPVHNPGLPQTLCWVNHSDSSCLTLTLGLINSRLRPEDRGEIEDLDYNRTQLVLSSAGRLGPSGTRPNVANPSRLAALAVGAWGVHVDRAETCTRCNDGFNNNNSRTNPAFAYCTTLGNIGQGACSNCLWMNNAVGCSLHPMFRGQDVPKDGLHESVEKDDDDEDDMGGRRGTRSRTRAGADKLEEMTKLTLRRTRGAGSSRRRSASPARK